MDQLATPLDVAALEARMMDGPLLTEDSAELAQDYERISVGRQFQAGKRLAQALAVAPGERVLDVGSGTGLLAEHIAGLVGPAGHVLGIEPLPLRVEIARTRARPNLEFRVGSAYDLSSIASASFDVVCLNAVFHWLPEKKGPLDEFARVLKPGGRLGIASGEKGHRSRLREVMGQVLARPPFSRHSRRGDITYRVGRREMHDLLEASGFEVKSIEVHDTRHAHASAEDVLRFSEASSFGNVLGHLPADLRPAARDAIVRALAPLAEADGTLVQEGRRMFAIAVKRPDRA